MKPIPLARLIPLLLAVPVSAVGQSIDYGALEALFEEPVTTSATGTPQRVTEAPADLRIITAEEIRRSAATDIPGILRQLAGLEVWRSTAAAVDATVRGYNQPYSPRLLVLINGRQVYKDYYAYTAWNALPINLAEIRQIEVVKGPNAALFGFNAVAGVVNILTYNPLYDDIDNATLRVGDGGYRALELVHTARLGERGGLRLSAGGYDSHEFDTELAPWEAAMRVDPRKRHLAADSLFQVGSTTQLGLELTHVEAQQTNLLPYYGLAHSDYDTSSIKATLSAESALGLLEGVVYRNQADVVLYSPFVSGGAGADMVNRTTVARLQDLFKLGAEHTFRLTGEFRHNELASTPIRGGEVHYNVWSLGAMWDWAVTDRLSLTNALRFDRLHSSRSGYLPAGFGFSNADFTRTLHETSWNSGLVYRPSEQDTFRLLAGRGVQLPSMIEGSFLMQQEGPQGTLGTAGNPELEPTQVESWSLVYDRRLPTIASTLRTTLFHLENESLKSIPGNLPTRLPPDADFPLYLFTNVGDSEANGLELGIAGARAGWRWETNYTYEVIQDDLTVNRTRLTYPVDFEAGTPRHKLNGHLGYSTGPWEWDLYGYYVGEYEMLTNGGDPLTIQRVKIPAYTLLDARIGYRIAKGVQLSLAGQGFNQAQHAETAGPEVERRLLLGLSLSY